ncbi:hypothetical protein NTE_00698 [Candidatus Nitrososphaera evergladensis SR1]|uniref:Uncharacterized protein n=1 Tax=Candidatus Nitrososphaera evergladensis SR1 TaxID=1459636 RepID=A0A075MNJ8_9ARCH|nr:hypothetical protein NTE_00698 [Candidatus Nitrososphaera evergladensis SR1]
MPAPNYVIETPKSIEQLFRYSYAGGREATAGQETDMQLAIQMLMETGLGFMTLTMIYAEEIMEMSHRQNAII